MKKQTLIINPTKEELKTLKLIDGPEVLGRLLEKVFGTTKDTFQPVLFTEKHARLLISNIENKIVALTKFSGKQLSTYQEAVEYISEVANQIYGNDWLYRMLKSEILASREPVLGFYTSNPKTIDSIQWDLGMTFEIVNKGQVANENNQ